MNSMKSPFVPLPCHMQCNNVNSPVSVLAVVRDLLYSQFETPTHCATVIRTCRQVTTKPGEEAFNCTCMQRNSV